MRIIETEIKSQIDTLNHILDLSAKYWRDISLFPDWTPKQFFEFGQSRYKREGQEILMRPKHYLGQRPFGDCDDFTILFLSYWIFRRNFPLKSFLVLCGKTRISHVYPILYNAQTKDLIGMDALPGNLYGFTYLYPITKFYTINAYNQVGIELNFEEFDRLRIDKQVSILYNERK